MNTRAEEAAAGAYAAYTDEMFARFENGDRLSFRDKAEAGSFLEEYLLQYRLYDIRTEIYSVARYDDYVILLYPGEGEYDRDSLKQSILEQFEVPKGNTSIEKITDVCRTLNENMVYDMKFADAALPSALKNGRGVCWHFAKIAAVLLRESGVPTTVTHGLLERESHIWLQCRLEDGTVIHVDLEEGILDEEHMRQLTLTPYVT